MATSEQAPDPSGADVLSAPPEQQGAPAPQTAQAPPPDAGQAPPMQGGSPASPGSVLAAPPQPQITAAPQPERHSLMKNILLGALAGLSADRPTDPNNTGGFGGLANAGGGFMAGRAAAQAQQDAPAEAAQKAALQKQQADKAQADINNTNARTAATLQAAQISGAKASVDARDADVKYADHMVTMSKNLSDLMQNGSGATLLTGSDGKPVDTIADAFKYAGGAGEAAKQIAAGTLVAVPTGPGKFEFYHVSPDWQHSKTAAPVAVTVATGYDPKTGDPITKTQTIPAGSVSNGTALSMQSSALTDTTKALTASTNKKKADTAAAKAQAGPQADPGASGGLNPAEYQAIVKGVAAGDIDAGSLLRYGKPVSEKILGDAKLLNPDFSNTDYQAKLGNARSFASGKSAEQIQSFNGMVGHIDAAQQAISGLRNTNSPLLNTPFNKLSELSGDPRVEALRVPLMAARTEFQNFLNNDHALSLQDVADGKRLLSDRMTPAQFETGAKQMMATAATRLGALNEKYKNTAGHSYAGIMSPQTRQILTKNGFGAQVGQMTDQQPGAPQPAAPYIAVNPKTGNKLKWENGTWLQWH